MSWLLLWTKAKGHNTSLEKETGHQAQQTFTAGEVKSGFAHVPTKSTYFQTDALTEHSRGSAKPQATLRQTHSGDGSPDRQLFFVLQVSFHKAVPQAVAQKAGLFPARCRGLCVYCRDSRLKGPFLSNNSALTPKPHTGSGCTSGSWGHGAGGGDCFGFSGNPLRFWLGHICLRCRMMESNTRRALQRL